MGESKGDEDVVHNLDGTRKLITRSFQNWHTHMQLSKRLLGWPSFAGVVRKSIFPTEMNLTKEYAKIGALASAVEMIKTGSTFACDMYHFPESMFQHSMRQDYVVLYVGLKPSGPRERR